MSSSDQSHDHSWQGPSNHVNSDNKEDIDEDYLNSYSPSARI